jgi:hypothetical protein
LGVEREHREKAEPDIVRLQRSLHPRGNVAGHLSHLA